MQLNDEHKKLIKQYPEQQQKCSKQNKVVLEIAAKVQNDVSILNTSHPSHVCVFGISKIYLK